MGFSLQARRLPETTKSYLRKQEKNLLHASYSKAGKNTHERRAAYLPTFATCMQGGHLAYWYKTSPSMYRRKMVGK